MKITAAIKDNTKARRDLAESIRAIDWNGHVPDEPAEPETDPAAVLLEVLQDTQEKAYQLAESLGISRAELSERSGVKAA